MDERLRKKARELLDDPEIHGFLGLKRTGTHIGPHCFTQGERLDELVSGVQPDGTMLRYPLVGIVRRLILGNPASKFAMMVKGCDERALGALLAWNQLEDDRVVSVGIACPQTQADLCDCPLPHPREWIVGEPADKTLLRSDSVSQPPLPKRRRFWFQQFAKCIKCYGCRNICPLCTCKECSLESDEVVRPGFIPPDFPMFHLVRAVHMIGRCVDCGLCEEACPAEIPLRTLYKKVNRIVFDHFGFRAGEDTGKRSPLHQLTEPPPTR